MGDLMDLLAEARDPSTSHARLSDLATHADTATQEAVASNPSSPPEALEAIAECADPEDWRLLAVLARNPRTPVETLRELAENDDSDVYEAAISNPSMPLQDLEVFAQSPALGEREAVGRNPSASADLLRLLATDTEYRDGEPSVRMAVASNPSAPTDVLRLLLADPDDRVGRVAAMHPAIPPIVLTEMATPILEEGSSDGRYSPGAIFGVALNERTPPDILSRLAAVEWLHETVARNPATPGDALARLSKKGRTCQEAVASNPNTPSVTLEELSELAAWDTNLEQLRKNLARNPAATEEILRRLGALDPPVLAVADHPSCPPDVVDRLTRKESGQ